MIDIHSHILYKLDDGAKSIEESIQIAEKMHKSGFTGICCTTHMLQEENKIAEEERYQEHIAELRKQLKEKQIPLDIYEGNELYIRETFREDIQKPQLHCLNNSQYVLIELPMGSKIRYLEEVCYELRRKKKIPIIAHPERYQYAQKDPNWLIKWIERGVLFQVNLGSLIGIYGKKAEKTAKIVLKHNMVHFVATDTHKNENLLENIQNGIRELEKLVGKQGKEELLELNPKKVIENQSIEILMPKKYKKWF